MRSTCASTYTRRSSALEVTAFELWREDGDALRNIGTGALLNFRGDAEGGDGVAVRAHGDTKPRRAAWRRTPRTRFALCRASFGIGRRKGSL